MGVWGLAPIIARVLEVDRIAYYNSSIGGCLLRDMSIEGIMRWTLRFVEVRVVFLKREHFTVSLHTATSTTFINDYKFLFHYISFEI